MYGNRFGKLNIFENHMEHDNDTYHESNISRGLGVTLSMEPMLRDRYIDLINARLAQVHWDAAIKCPVPKPVACSEVIVSFMQNAFDLSDYFDYANFTQNAPRRVLCLALTPGGDGAFGVGEATYVTVSCEDDLVVMAVRTRDGAGGASEKGKKGGADKKAPAFWEIGEDVIEKIGVIEKIIQLPGIGWDEMIDTIRDVHCIREEGMNSVTGHYLDYLGSRLPEFRPLPPAAEGVVVPVDFELPRVIELGEFCKFNELCELCVLYDFCKLRKINISA